MQISLNLQTNKATWSPSPLHLPELDTTLLRALSHHRIIVLSLFSALQNSCPHKIVHSLKFREKKYFFCEVFPEVLSGQNCSFSPWINITRNGFHHLVLYITV